MTCPAPSQRRSGCRDRRDMPKNEYQQHTPTKDRNISQTYHKRHSNKLRSRDDQHHRRQHLPPNLPRAPTAHQHHNIRDQHRQLENHREVHQEARAPPHAAEGPVVPVTVLVLGERRAQARDARASFVQTVRNVDGVVVRRRGVADPVGERDRGDCARCCA